jgi:hypothetical protein
MLTVNIATEKLCLRSNLLLTTLLTKYQEQLLKLSLKILSKTTGILFFCRQPIKLSFI